MGRVRATCSCELRGERTFSWPKDKCTIVTRKQSCASRRDSHMHDSATACEMPGSLHLLTSS
eukprot:3203860-Rhodomonas_salina.2